MSSIYSCGFLRLFPSEVNQEDVQEVTNISDYYTDCGILGFFGTTHATIADIPNSWNFKCTKDAVVGTIKDGKCEVSTTIPKDLTCTKDGVIGTIKDDKCEVSIRSNGTPLTTIPKDLLTHAKETGKPVAVSNALSGATQSDKMENLTSLVSNNQNKIVREQAVPLSEWTTFAGKNCYGPEYTQLLDIGNIGVDDCKSKCKSEENCSGFTINANTARCWLWHTENPPSASSCRSDSKYFAYLKKN